MWQKVALLAIGGAAGTLCRVGLSEAIDKAAGHPWPFGTLMVNLLGCFLFGLIWAMVDAKWVFGQAASIAVLAGFMGAFTTFSTFAFQTHDLHRQALHGWALANIAVQNVVGITLIFVGVWLGNMIAKWGTLGPVGAS